MDCGKGTKMKSSTTLVLIAVAVCCALSLVFGGTDVGGQSPEVGRYALESGEYLAPSHAAERRLPGIFKIDTATGRVWRYASHVEDKVTTEEWVPISE